MSSATKFLRLLPFIIMVLLLLLSDSGDAAWIRRGRSGRIALQQNESAESVNRTENHDPNGRFAVEHSAPTFVNRRVEEDYHQQMAGKQLYHHHRDDEREEKDPMLEEEANNNSKVTEEEHQQQQQQQQNARHRNNSNAHEVEHVVVAAVAEPRDPMLEEAERSQVPFVRRRSQKRDNMEAMDVDSAVSFDLHYDESREDPMLEEVANRYSKQIAPGKKTIPVDSVDPSSRQNHDNEQQSKEDPMLDEAEGRQVPFVRGRNQKMHSPLEAMDVDSAVSFDHHHLRDENREDPMLEEVANSKVAAQNKTFSGASAVPSHHQPADNEQHNKEDPMLEEAENNAIEEAKDGELIAAKHQLKNVHRRNNGHDDGGGVAVVDPMMEEAGRQVVAKNGSKQQKSAILREYNGATEANASASSTHGINKDQHNPQDSAVSEHLRGGENELALNTSSSCSSDADDAILQLVPFATEKTRQNAEAAVLERPAEHQQQHHPAKQLVFPHPGIPLKKRKHQHIPQKKPVSEHRVRGENLNTAELRPFSSSSDADDENVPQLVPLASGGIRQTPAEHPAAEHHMFPNKFGVPLKKRKYPQMSLTSISAQNAIGDNRASGANANASSDQGIIEHAPPEDMAVVVEGRGEKLNTEFRPSSSSSSHDDNTLTQLVPFADGTRQHPAEAVAEHPAAEHHVFPHPKKRKHQNAIEQENNADATGDNGASGANTNTNVSSYQHKHLFGGEKINAELRPSSSSFFSSSSSSNDDNAVPQLQLVPFAAEDTMQQNPPEDTENPAGHQGVPLKKRKHHRMLLSSVYARESDLQNRNTAKDDDEVDVVVEDAVASSGGSQQILEGFEKQRYKAARKRPESHINITTDDTDEEQQVEVETPAAAIGIGTHANLANDDASIPAAPLMGEQEGSQQEAGQEEEEEHQQQTRLSDPNEKYNVVAGEAGPSGRTQVSASVKKNDFHGRTRTTFTKSQLRTLRESFAKQNCLEDDEWKRLRQVLGLRLGVIGNWFLHAQYIKKKMEQPLAQHPAADEQQNGATEIRKYTKFTEPQKRTLRASFAKQYWLEDEEWIRLSDELGLELKVIGDWFLNTRRQKAKEASSNALEQQCSNRTTKFTKSQLRTLRESFAKQNWLEDEEWIRLSQVLGLRLQVIANWFLHTRHIKKKMEQPLAQHPATDEQQDNTTTKQKYTQFTESQKRILRASFAKQHWLQDEEWIRLSRELGLRLGVVGNWFKNARRQKPNDASKVLEQQQQSPQQQAINSQKTRFTKLQLGILRDAFAKKKRPDEEELERLSRKMDLPYRVIKTWFERQRTAAKVAQVKQQTPQQCQATDEQAGTAMPLEEANTSRSHVVSSSQKQKGGTIPHGKHKRQQLQEGELPRFLAKKPRTQRMPLSQEEQQCGGSAGSSASEG